MSIRKTITFSEEVENMIEDYRAKHRPIPTFTDAVIDLVVKGLEHNGL